MNTLGGMIDLFVQLNPGYTHEQVEEMPYHKMLHYLELRTAPMRPQEGTR